MRYVFFIILLFTALLSPPVSAVTTSLNLDITVTSGAVIDAAASYCAANGGGSGTSASPWRYNCIQAAVDAASPGDTIYLAGGNWRLDTGDAGHVIINKKLSLLGAGSGNTFDVYGHVNNASGASLCPTSGTSITCVYGTGTSYAHGVFHPPAGAGYIFIGVTTGPPSTSCTGTIKNISFDGSKTTAGGADMALLSIFLCKGQIVIDNIRFLAFENSALNGETQISVLYGENIVVQNSMFASPVSGVVSHGYNNAQTLQFTGGNGIGKNYLIRNNVFYQGAFNPIYLSNVTYTGNIQLTYDDGIGWSDINALGYAGAGIGGPVLSYCPENGQTTGQCGGDYDLINTNNVFYAGNRGFAIGGGVNDFGTSGGLNNFYWTGNWVIGSTGVIDTCIWHIFDDQANCVGGVIGMAINMAVDASCNMSNNGTAFSVTNNSIIATTAAHLNARGHSALGIGCKLGSGGTSTFLPINIYGFNAQKNYLQSPSNQYLINANTIDPIQTNNFCSPAAGTVTGCATSGFTTPPTCSFTAGTFAGSTLPFTSTTFTAQYGAVQWLASTTSTTPLASDSRWSSNNTSFPNSAANSYVPPVQLSGVNHGNTVYMWVMDSANQIGSCGSVAIP